MPWITMNGRHVLVGEGSEHGKPQQHPHAAADAHQVHKEINKQVILGSLDKTPQSPNMPIRKQIIHDPSTGSKKPYEVWAHYQSGASRRLGSFKTEASARKSQWWK
jgi:hypothetical protein